MMGYLYSPEGKGSQIRNIKSGILSQESMVTFNFETWPQERCLFKRPVSLGIKKGKINTTTQHDAG